MNLQCLVVMPIRVENIICVTTTTKQYYITAQEVKKLTDTTPSSDHFGAHFSIEICNI